MKFVAIGEGREVQELQELQELQEFRSNWSDGGLEDWSDGVME
jgi:hypothetical protein